jgi:hypothetical protein
VSLRSYLDNAHIDDAFSVKEKEMLRICVKLQFDTLFSGKSVALFPGLLELIMLIVPPPLPRKYAFNTFPLKIQRYSASK